MKMNIDEIRKKNLSILVKETGGVTAFSKKLKKSQSQVSQLLMEKSARKIGDKLSMMIEKEFKKPRGWLDMESIHLECSAVPLINWDEVIKLDEVKNSIFDHDMIATQEDVSSESFALEVLNDTMESPHSISFPEKSIIIVDPEKTALSSSFVIMRDGKSDSVIFRQLILDGAQIYLKPLNSRYPVIKLDENPLIYGVVCGVSQAID